MLRAFFIEVTQMKLSVKKMCVLAMLAAIAFVLANTLHISIFPAAPFLKYEPKDVVITIGGFLFGPLASLLISVVVSLPEVMVSGTGPVGCLMDVLSTCSFACVAALFYKKRHDLTGAILEDAAYQSYLRIRPAYYDVTLQGKLARNEDTVEMLNIMLSHLNPDLSVAMVGAGLTIDTDMRSIYSNDLDQYTSVIKASAKVNATLLEKAVAKISGLKK